MKNSSCEPSLIEEAQRSRFLQKGATEQVGPMKINGRVSGQFHIVRRAVLLPLSSLLLALTVTACSDDSSQGQVDASVDAEIDARPPKPDAYIGACQDDPVPVFQGDQQVVINSLEIGDYDEGFDLDWDGEPDNILASFGTVANGPLRDSFSNGDIWIPMEFFGMSDQGPVDNDCVNFAIYGADYAPDRDHDGDRTDSLVGRTGHDCNDWDSAINGIGAEELPGDRVDNDCDGMADETSDATPTTDASDMDGDGYSLADGDCDDRVAADWPDAPDFWDPAQINPGQEEICGDGLDNNCNGEADEGCDPYVAPDNPEDLCSMPVDEQTLQGSDPQQGIIVFRSGRIEDHHLYAGPSEFRFDISVDHRDTELRLTSAVMEATITPHVPSAGILLTNGRLGGVLNAQSLDSVPNPISDYYGTPDNTLLDVFVGSGGLLLGLPTVGRCLLRPGQTGEGPMPPPECNGVHDCDAYGDNLYCDRDIRAPDIDVDGDGIEIFLDMNLDEDDQVTRVDTCIDGDGTVIQDEMEYSGQACDNNDDCLQSLGEDWFCSSSRLECFRVTNCTQAKDEHGNYRFVDGYSIMLKLEAVPVKLLGTY